MVAEVRRLEQEVGCGVVHMFGTNSEREEVEASATIDYTATHGKVGISGPWMGKYRLDNEHNPPYSPAVERLMYCKARNAGQAWWYWRGAHSKADMDATFALWKDGCDGVQTTGCPFSVRPTQMLRCKPMGSHHGFPLWDCTPLDSTSKPIWPEGDAELRSSCETKSMGGMPTYVLDPPLRVESLQHGGMAFTVAGHGTSPAHCSIPNPGPGFKGCVNTTNGALVVSVP